MNTSAPLHLYLRLGFGRCCMSWLKLCFLLLDPEFLCLWHMVGRSGCNTQPGLKPESKRIHTLTALQRSSCQTKPALEACWRLHLRVDASWCQGYDSDWRWHQLAVIGSLVFSFQDVLQALLQHLTGYSSTRGVDEFWIQVEGTGRGSAGQLSAATRLQASLQDPTQLWRSVLEEDSLSGMENIKTHLSIWEISAFYLGDVVRPLGFWGAAFAGWSWTRPLLRQRADICPPARRLSLNRTLTGWALTRLILECHRAHCVAGRLWPSKRVGSGGRWLQIDGVWSATLVLR